jgi:antitoxin HigA-1
MMIHQNREIHMARTPIHPGETLRDDLEALGMSAAELSRQISVPVNRITQILNGTRAITGDTALRLGHFFSTSPEFWINLQKLYDLRVAEQAKGEEVAKLPKFDAKAWENSRKRFGQTHMVT